MCIRDRSWTAGYSIANDLLDEDNFNTNSDTKPASQQSIKAYIANQAYTHPNHSGEVTSSADGAQTIADNVVDEDNLKISNSGTNGQFLSKQSGNTGGLTWADPSGGATGGGSDALFMEYDKVMTTSYSISANKNAMTIGPVALNSDVVLTIPSTSKLLVLN